MKNKKPHLSKQRPKSLIWQYIYTYIFPAAGMLETELILLHHHTQKQKPLQTELNYCDNV
jgi:hypothetical protein